MLQLQLPLNLAAIDVGSNAIRLLLGVVDETKILRTLKTVREPVRLGQNVFVEGSISEETTERAVDAFLRFKSLMDQSHVAHCRAVGTSALREAHNRDVFIDRIALDTGIEIRIIGGEEEARLIHLAVSRAYTLKGKLGAVIDIGGGSVEVTLTDDGEIVASQSMNMGTVRLLQKLQDGRFKEKDFEPLVREYADATKSWLKQMVGKRKVDLCVGTGGNVEALGDLRRRLLNKEANRAVSRDELDAIFKKLAGMTVMERVNQLKLRPDRADVILPATIVLQTLVRQMGVDEVLIPNVGLKDGVLLDLVDELFGNQETRQHRHQAVASALQLGGKYFFDEAHAQNVARLAVRVFDETRALHHLTDDSRFLLEMAALLHDVGKYINVSGHHKHSYYLINASPLIGLSDAHRAIVSNVARYHRKSPPNLQHDPYRMLQPKDRLIVSKLAGMLRLADALDAEHAGKVENVSITYNRPRLIVKMQGQGDLLLERWAIYRKAGLLEEVLGVKLEIE